MPASLDGHHILLSPDDRTAIMEAKSLDQIFIVLNQYWTFVQYELLEYVVQEYGNDDLKKEMKAYIEAMDEFEAQIGIDHFTAIRMCSSRPDSVAMEIHLSGSQHRLRDARNVQRSMAEQCGLHPHTVRTYQSTPGSTILTLLIPYSVAGHVMATFQGMLPTGDLLSRPLEDRIVYTMDEAETEMHLPLVMVYTYNPYVCTCVFIHAYRVYQHLQNFKIRQVVYILQQRGGYVQCWWYRGVVHLSW